MRSRVEAGVEHVCRTVHFARIDPGIGDRLPGNDDGFISTSKTTTYNRTDVAGVGIFYREAGPKNAPTIVLLHGYPSSSRMFDGLLPLLATRYHLIAPDYPGFGQSDAPPPSKYHDTFDQLAQTTNSLLEKIGVQKYILYLQDYGGPVGLRMAVRIRNESRRSSFKMPIHIGKAWVRNGRASSSIGTTLRGMRSSSMRFSASRGRNIDT